MEPLICRKDVQRILSIDRTTLWRWECQGLHFTAGRISEAQLVWWLELRDAARDLGLDPRPISTLPRAAQEKILAAAHELRSAGKV